jgi:integrase
MARKSPGGVLAKGADRIEFTFIYKGKRYRPTVQRAPSAANLRRAQVQLQDIKARIKSGTFNFAEEFPDYRFIDGLEEVQREKARQREEARQQEAERNLARSRLQTCNHVFDAFLAHCETRVAMNDLAYSTVHGYRQVLNSAWRPQIGSDVFEEVRYSRLAGIAAAHTQNKKTYNSIVSALRCAFGFGYQDHPEKHNPAAGLRTLRITKKDRRPIDPFTIQEGEAIIARSHAEFGEAHGNYEEFRFFTGLRQSEQIALKTSDCDLANGKIRITHVRVRRREKDRTKTGEDREIALCPRAFQVLQRQLALRQALAARGLIDHDFIFFQDNGAPIIHLSHPWARWRYVVAKTQVRYREPYNARHSWISWRLMLGTNVLLVAKEDGHSIQTMLSTYARWTEGSTEADIATIRQALEYSAVPRYTTSLTDPLGCSGIATRVPLDGGWGRLSWRKARHFRDLNGGADGRRKLRLSY